MSELLSNHDFKFQKKYGQNFLTDSKIPSRIADECTGNEGEKDGEGRSEFLMLEVGPGAGILTKELAKRFCRVVAVEIDEALKPVLSESLADFDNIEVHFGDVMELELSSFLKQRRAYGEKVLPVSVCANLPYYITTPIIMKLLEEYGEFRYITVMVQKEVAQRLCASAGSAEYGAITAQINLYGTVKRLFTVPSGCFFPRPKVDSAVIQIELYKQRKYTPEEIAGASKLIKAAFSMRRKTLANGISQCFPEIPREQLAKVIDECLGMGESVRGERLTSDDFVKLSGRLRRTESAINSRLC